MTAFIIKSSLSLILLYGLYWFLLRKEKLFVFNRFFLILAIIFSLAIPFLSLPENIFGRDLDASLSELPVSNTTRNIEELFISDLNSNQPLTEAQPAESGVNYLMYISLLALGFYLAGSAIFLIRFLRNISSIFRNARNEVTTNYLGHRLVLVEERVNPHCFMNRIFVNRADYTGKRIDDKLLAHEVEHIRQSHSFDIVMIELIRIFYWFNPVLVLFDRAIRENHEYLADNGVLKDSEDITDYADKLISFITSSRNVPLTSGFNSSLTKKRLVMISKSKPELSVKRMKIILTLNLTLVFLFIISIIPSSSLPISNTFPSIDFSVFRTSENENSTRPQPTGTNPTINMPKPELISTNQVPASNPETILPPTSQKEVKGFVVNKFGNYLQDVTVTVSDNRKEVKTDDMGYFELENVPEKASVTFSVKGYGTRTMEPDFTYAMLVKLLPDGVPEDKPLTVSDTAFFPKVIPLMMIDGAIAEKVTMAEIDPSKVVSMNVLKTSEATEKYGEKGKYGAIEIISTRYINNPQAASTKSNNAATKNNSLVIVDGILYKGELNDIPVETISSLSVRKYKSDDDKYGQAGKEKVIEIKTKNSSTGSPVQQKTVKGIIQNEDGKPLNDASIVCVVSENVSSGMKAGPDGRFSIDNVSPDNIFKIGCFGYMTRIVKPVFTSDMVITLEKNPMAAEVKEVLFRKADFTASGVLVVINGKILESKDHLIFNPREIESFKILNGKEATGKYGNKGKNGVLEIFLSGNNAGAAGTKQAKGFISDTSKYITLLSVNYTGDRADLIDIPVSNLQSAAIWNYTDTPSNNKKKLRSISIMTRDFYKVRGIIADKNEKPLPGVSVTATDNPNREISDKNGRFLIEDVRENIMLEFSLAGYKPYYLATSTVVFTTDMKIELERDNVPEKDVFFVAEKMPQYPGGEMELKKFIAMNMNYPEEARTQKAEGVVIVRFVVTSKGNVEDVQLVQKVHPAIDAEVLRIVGRLGKFVPGMQRGTPVDVYYNLPVTFSLPKTNQSKSEKIQTSEDKTDQDFSGKWVLNNSKSTLFLNNAQVTFELNISQKGSSIEIQRIFRFPDRDPMKRQHTYDLENRGYASVSDDSTTTVKALWAPGKQSFTIITEAIIKSKAKPEIHKRIETYSIADKGNTLIVNYNDILPESSLTPKDERNYNMVYDRN
jgi:TonB family protein